MPVDMVERDLPGIQMHQLAITIRLNGVCLTRHAAEVFAIYLQRSC